MARRQAGSGDEFGAHRRATGAEGSRTICTDGGRSAASVCLHCGAALDAGHRFCPRCGTARRAKRGRLRRGLATVARNVEDLLWGALGWTLLVVGALTALVTAPGAAIGAGSLAVGTAVALVGLLLVGLGVLCNPRFGRQIARRHEPTTVGRVRTVDHRVVRPGERCYEPCAVCGDGVDAGVVRRRRDELVVAGLPVYAFEIGHNHYCAGCAEEHVFAGPDVGAVSASGADVTPTSDADAAFGGDLDALDRELASEHGEGDHLERDIVD